MGDFNIDFKSSFSDKDKLEKFLRSFQCNKCSPLENLLHEKYKSIIDLILTNKPSNLRKTHVVEDLATIMK